MGTDDSSCEGGRELGYYKREFVVETWREHGFHVTGLLTCFDDVNQASCQFSVKFVILFTNSQSSVTLG